MTDSGDTSGGEEEIAFGDDQSFDDGALDQDDATSSLDWLDLNLDGTSLLADPHGSDDESAFEHDSTGDDVDLEGESQLGGTTDWLTPPPSSPAALLEPPPDWATSVIWDLGHVSNVWAGRHDDGLEPIPGYVVPGLLGQPDADDVR